MATTMTMTMTIVTVAVLAMLDNIHAFCASTQKSMNLNWSRMFSRTCGIGATAICQSRCGWCGCCCCHFWSIAIVKVRGQR